MPRSGGRSKKQRRETRLATDAAAAQPDRGDSSNFFRALAPADHEGTERGEQAGVGKPEQQPEKMADGDAGAASGSRSDDGEPSPTDDEQPAEQNYSSGLQSDGGCPGMSEPLPPLR